MIYIIVIIVLPTNDRVEEGRSGVENRGREYSGRDLMTFTRDANNNGQAKTRKAEVDPECIALYCYRRVKLQHTLMQSYHCLYSTVVLITFPLVTHILCEKK